MAAAMEGLRRQPVCGHARFGTDRHAEMALVLLEEQAQAHPADPQGQIDKAINENDNRISVIMPVDLPDLVYGGIDALNDLAQDRIIGNNDVFLTDISYHVAGSIAPMIENDAVWTEGTVLLGVNAVLEPSG